MLEFPFEINDVPSQINLNLLDHFKGKLEIGSVVEKNISISGEKDGFVQVGPSKYFFPKQFKENASMYYNFEARSSDIWVSSFPRSGTTWTQEMVWLIGNNLDFERARNDYLTNRFPFFE